MSSFARFIRWKDWGPGKTTILSGLCFYLAAAYQLPFVDFAARFVFFLLFASAQSALGFVLNDRGDRELDHRQGKANPFNALPAHTLRFYVGLVLALAAASGLPFVMRAWFLPLWLVWAFAAAAYSLPPLRFKTRGVPGLAFSFIAQWSLPVLLAFAAFGRAGHADMWLWTLALTASGATLEIAHQRYDRQRDAATRAGTFAVRTPPERLDRLYALAVLFDKLAVGLIAALAVASLVRMSSWWAWGMAAGLAALYLGLLALSLPGAWRALRGGAIQDPYYGSGPSFARLLHETLPNFGLPVALLFAIALKVPAYFVLLSFFAFWRLALGGARFGNLLKVFKRNPQEA
ncbi:MAG: UbiA family prenyltransferase [Chloroflexota bacterium]